MRFSATTLRRRQRAPRRLVLMVLLRAHVYIAAVDRVLSEFYGLLRGRHLGAAWKEVVGMRFAQVPEEQSSRRESSQAGCTLMHSNP